MGKHTDLSSTGKGYTRNNFTATSLLDNSILNKTYKVETGKSFKTHGPMMATANSLLHTKVNQVKTLTKNILLDHVASGERLPDAATLEKKRSISKIDNVDKNVGLKIRENKIYCTRDDQKYYTSNKVLMN